MFGRLLYDTLEEDLCTEFKLSLVPTLMIIKCSEYSVKFVVNIFYIQTEFFLIYFLFKLDFPIKYVFSGK